MSLRGRSSRPIARIRHPSVAHVRTTPPQSPAQPPLLGGFDIEQENPIVDNHGSAAKVDRATFQNSENCAPVFALARAMSRQRSVDGLNHAKSMTRRHV